MPRGGRNAKPTKLKLVEGTYRSDQAPKHEVMPTPMVPKPPASMDRYARQAWRRLAPLLKRLGMLTEADAEMFLVLCEAWGRWEHARRRLAWVLRAAFVAELPAVGEQPKPSSDILRIKQKLKDGKVVDEEQIRLRDFAVGQTMPKEPTLQVGPKDRAVAVSADLLALIRTAEISVERAEFSFRQLATEFGLSPAARTRLDVYAPPPETETDEYERIFGSGQPS